jgi:hypothetical protein
MTTDPDGRRFADDATGVYEQAVPFLVEWFGPRCRDFEPDCEACRRWAALDVLLDNPWKNDK